MKTILQTSGMSCGHCEARMVKTLMNVDGVRDCTADANSGLVTVEHDEAVSKDDLKVLIEDIGFDVL